MYFMITAVTVKLVQQPCVSDASHVLPATIILEWLKFAGRLFRGICFFIATIIGNNYVI